MKIEIKNRWDNKVLVSGKYENIKDCLEKNRDANLRYSNLRYSDLGGSDLRYSNLRYSDLSGIKNYSEHHTIFQEVVRQQKIDTFTQKEWSIIGQIIVHRLCWDSIKKRFNKSAMGIFKKLKKVGFDEWEEKYK